MGLKTTLDKDLKQALLGGDRLKSDTIRMLKSVILNEEIAKNKRDQGLSDEEIISCLKKESKKRQEAADLYTKAGSAERAKKELSEKNIIQEYLPESMSESDIASLIDKIIAEQEDVSIHNIGLVIGKVKQASNGMADGAVIAKLVKEKLN